MEFYCKAQDGGRKNRLIREAISYIENFCLPGEENRRAKQTADALARIPFLKTYVTTNWDPFLERSLDVLVPVVEDRDLAFWDDRKRQVLKIHGTISRPHSIIATSVDYDRCISDNPLIFNKLRDMLTTKTFLFLGYSMRDADFREVWTQITARLGPFARFAYSVNPNATDAEIQDWHGRGVGIFRTTDTLFLSSLQAKLEQNGEVATTDFLDFLRKERSRITSIHIKNDQKSSGKLASAMYQDGLLHELDDLLGSVGLGTKRNLDFEAARRDAEKNVEHCYRKEDLVEIAYWTGRFSILDHYSRRDFSQIGAYLNPNNMKPSQRLVKGSVFEPPHSLKR